MFYEGNVNDVIERNGVLWVATGEGIVTIDSASGAILPELLPSFLKSLTTDLLAMDNNGRIWGGSEQRIWRFESISGEFIQYGSEWMTNGEHDSQLVDMN